MSVTHDPVAPSGDRPEPTRTNAGPVVLNLIRRHDGVSRTELALRTGVSAQAISKIVARLVEQGLVWESGRQSVGVGKARTRLSIISQSRYAIGIHLDRTGAFMALVNLAGEIEDSRRLEYALVPSGEETANMLAEQVEDLLSNNESVRSKVIGCGIAMTGLVDHSTGVATAPNNFSGWRNVPLAHLLSEKIEIPVLLDKDTNSAMLSEHWQAPGKGWNVVIYMGSGIGAGWTIDGEVYRGSNSDAGEFGHTIINPDGPMCVCGRKGCVEVFTSPAAVVQKFDLATTPSGAPAGTVAWNSKTAERLIEIAALARKGNLEARAALYDSGYYLGISAANLVTLLDINSVTLAGPMIDVVGPHYLRGVEDGFMITETDPGRHAQISVSPDLQTEQIASGAAFLFLNGVGI